MQILEISGHVPPVRMIFFFFWHQLKFDNCGQALFKVENELTEASSWWQEPRETVIKSSSVDSTTVRGLSRKNSAKSDYTVATISDLSFEDSNANHIPSRKQLQGWQRSFFFVIYSWIDF